MKFGCQPLNRCMSRCPPRCLLCPAQPELEPFRFSARWFTAAVRAGSHARAAPRVCALQRFNHVHKGSRRDKKSECMGTKTCQECVRVRSCWLAPLKASIKGEMCRQSVMSQELHSSHKQHLYAVHTSVTQAPAMGRFGAYRSETLVLDCPNFQSSGTCNDHLAATFVPP